MLFEQLTFVTLMQRTTNTKLGRYLEEKGIMNIWLANKLGVYKTTIGRYCKGKVEPDSNTWALIAKYLEVPLDRIK